MTNATTASLTTVTNSSAPFTTGPTASFTIIGTAPTTDPHTSAAKEMAMQGRIIATAVSATVVALFLLGSLLIIQYRSRKVPDDDELHPHRSLLIPSQFKEWEFSRKRLRFLEELGEGFFGTVYKAQAHGLTVLGKWSTVAVKMIKSKQVWLFIN